MSDQSDDLPKHVIHARDYLPPEKARAFEETYRRMRSKARNWSTPPLPANGGATAEIAPSDSVVSK